MHINFDDHTSDLIAWHANATGLSENDLIEKLLSAHLAELWELRTFLETSGIDGSRRDQAINLLQSFGGGESIMQGIERIDPKYKTLEARFLPPLKSASRPIRR